MYNYADMYVATYIMDAKEYKHVYFSSRRTADS